MSFKELNHKTEEKVWFYWEARAVKGRQLLINIINIIIVGGIIVYVIIIINNIFIILLIIEIHFELVT